MSGCTKSLVAKLFQSSETGADEPGIELTGVDEPGMELIVIVFIYVLYLPLELSRSRGKLDRRGVVKTKAVS